jgi:hypothetical protein
LLGIGLKLCIKSRLPSNKIASTIERFKHDVRVKYFIKTQEPQEDPDFNPKLYIEAPWWIPSPANRDIEDALSTFEERLTANHEQYQKQCQPKITVLQNSALHELKDNEQFIVVEAQIKTWVSPSGITKTLSSKSSKNISATGMSTKT